jgi:DNA-binding transcriptional ArsR family regulator
MNKSRDDEDLVWKALAHSTRRQILDVLFESPSSTGAVVDALEMERHVVMAHLAVLREADLVTTEKRGRVRINHLNAIPIQQIHHRWITPTSGPWATALIAVRDAAERKAADSGADDKTIDDWKQSG